MFFIMSNYNEALESEKRTLATLVETSFYPRAAQAITQQPVTDAEAIYQAMQNDPDLSKQILQTLLANAIGAK